MCACVRGVFEVRIVPPPSLPATRYVGVCVKGVGGGAGYIEVRVDAASESKATGSV